MPGASSWNVIVFPGQACILCLCATQEELFLDSEAKIATRRYINLAITYDHRIVNGRGTILQEIRRAIR
jgi:pyruvate/2-oxoglutarate dehydrogenase complex dihydrolipoamide acyltransferase (E2) component